MKIIRHSNLFERVARGAIWTGFGNGLKGIIQFGVLIILARHLVPEDFGIVSAAMVVVGLSQIFSLLGMGPAIVQRSTLTEKHICTAFSVSLVLGLMFYVLVYKTAPLVENFFNMDGLTEILQSLALLFPISGLGVVSESLALREMKFRYLSKVMLASYAFGYAFFGVSFALMGYGAFALVVASLAQAVLKTFLLMVVYRHSVIPFFEIKAFKELMYFSGGFTLARLGNYTATQGDNIVVGRLLGAANLGIYGRAYQMMMIPAQLIGSVLNHVLFPAMASFQNNRDKLAQTYRRGMSAVAILVLPFSAFLIVYGSEIVTLVLGEQWKDVVIPLQILAAGLLFRTSYKIGDALARATGAVYRRAWRQWVAALSVVFLAAIGTLWGAPGVAVGVCVAIFINYLLVAQLSLKITGLSWRDFIAAHMPGLRLALVCGALGLVLKLTLSLYLSFLLLVIIAGSLNVIIVVMAWWLFPKIFLAQDGLWFLKRLNEVFPGIANIVNKQI